MPPEPIAAIRSVSSEPIPEFSAFVMSPSSEPEPEPATEPEPEVSSEPGAFEEPHPEWSSALPIYGVAWEIHVYGISALFAILVLVALANVIAILSIPRLRSKGYFICLNTLMFGFGVLRAVYMFVDAYNVNGTYGAAGSYFLINVALPFLTSAFYVLLAALYRVTKMQQIRMRVFSPGYLCAVVAVFFVVQITTDAVVGFVTGAIVLALICEIFFLVWGLTFCVLYFVLFAKLYYTNVVKRRRRLRAMTASSQTLGARDRSSSMDSLEVHPVRMEMTLRLTASIAVTFLLLIGAHVLGLIVYGTITGSSSNADPWPWWVYNFMVRVLELVMCFTIVYVAMAPVRKHYGSQLKSLENVTVPSPVTNVYKMNGCHGNDKDVIGNGSEGRYTPRTTNPCVNFGYQ